MSRTFLFLTLILSSSVLANADIDALFRDYDHASVPGAAVTVIKDGAVHYSRAYGLEDVEAKLAATTDTNYRLASLSKAFTAMAILILAERGKLDLEDRLTTLFPDFPSYGSPIRVRHLLNHISGLRDYEDLIPSGQTAQLLDKDVVAILKKQSSTYFTPGSSYRYSNSGYAILAEIVAKASGISFARFLDENIFKVLGMKGTVAYENGISEVSHRAYGYSRSGSGFKRTDQSLTSAVLGDGGVYTSVDDLLLWDQALYDSSLVSAATLQAAFTPGKLNDGGSVPYGFGWMLGTYQGLKRISHTGSTIGFRTAIQRLPQRGLTVAVLVNRAESTPWDIAEKILGMFVAGKGEGESFSLLPRPLIR